jgi:hypothetical protein
MNNQIPIFKRPMVWVSIAVIYMWLFSLSIFIASIGPPLVIAKIVIAKNVMSLTAINNAFLLYVQEASNKLNVKYNFILFSLVLNVLLFLPTVIIGIFVLRKHLWARNGFLGLLMIFLISPFALVIFTSESIFGIFNLTQLPLIVFIFLFTRNQIKCIFT